MVFQRSGASRSDIRSQNISAILLALLHGEGVSRVKLAQQLGVSTTTITNLITELNLQGLVSEEGVIKSRKASVGRPQMALHLVPEARLAVGVHIGIGAVRIGITNLFGDILASHILYPEPHAQYDWVRDEIITAINDLLRQFDREQVTGVGVGASGLVDAMHGVNVIAPNLRWRNVPIGTDFATRLQLPVHVENNVRMMAMGEAYFGAARDVHAVAFVYSRIGVGAGLVMGGQLYRGAAAGAGEIGHNIILLDDDAECTDNNTLEALISEPALLEIAESIRQHYPDGVLAQAAEGLPLNIETLFTAVEDGDEHVLNMLRHRARYFGIALANLVNVMNPELILVGGTYAQPWLLPVIKQSVQQCAFAGLGQQVRVEKATFGDDAGVIGAAAMALDRFFFRQGV